MKDREKEALLFDYYGVLLTPHQKEVMSDYYYNDLSMQEIAENYGVSKSAISDLVKRCLSQLSEYEMNLHLLSQSEKRDGILEEMMQSDNREVIAYAKRLTEIE